MISAVLHTLLAFGALWILVFYCWRPYRLDSLRDKLFELRHELFAMVESKEVSFDSPAYWMLRAQLNRMLIMADEVARSIEALDRIPEDKDALVAAG